MSGGTAETAQVDALDEQAVEIYLAAVAKKAGGIDVSFNAISRRWNLSREASRPSEAANVAAFVASDRASLMTGTVVNLSGGSIVD